MPEEGGTSIVAAARLYDKAHQAMQSQQYDYAISLFKSALGLDEDFIKAKEGLKVARMKKFQSGSELGRNMKGILFMIQALVYKKLKRWERAAEKYEKLLAVVPPQVPILPHLGDVYWEGGNTSEAINTYKAVLRLNEGDLYSLKRLGEIYLEQEMRKEAKYYYEKFVALKPEDIEMSRQLKNLDALLTIDKGTWEEGTTFIEKTVDRAKAREEAKKKVGELRQEKEVLSKKPKEIPSLAGVEIKALFQQAETFLNQNRVDDATDRYKKIIEADPNNARAHQALGEIYIRERYFDEAIEEYEKVIEVDSKNKSILDSLANLYVRKGEIDKAIEKYEKIVVLDAKNPVTYKVLGDFYLKKENKDKAIELYRKVADLDPKNAVIHKTLGDLYLEGDELDKGIKEYEKQAELEPNKLATHEKLGDLYLEKEDFARAKEKYERALEIEPDSRIIQRKLKEIEFKKFDTIIRKCEETLQASPDNVEAAKQMEKAKNDKLNLMVEDCQERIKNDPKDIPLRFELGKLYKEQGKVNEALGEFQAAVNEPAVRRQTLYMIGICFQERNMLDMAVAQLEKALAVNPGAMDEEAKEIRYQLGQIYEKMGQTAQALSEYKKIYEVDITYKDVTSKIESAYKK